MTEREREMPPGAAPPTAANEADEPEATAEELAGASALREALSSGDVRNRDVALAASLRAALAPSELSDARHAALVAAAVARAPAPRGLVLRVSFGVASALALAAGVALFVGSGPVGPPGPPLAVSRSTAPLFAEPYPLLGGTSSRVDLVAMVRDADLRENRFRSWGVR